MSKTRATQGPSSPSIPIVWLEFGQRLSSVLQSLQEDQFLIISAKQSNMYVQFAGQGFYGLHVETISNQYLSETEHLDDSQIHMLMELGWNRPTDGLESEEKEKSPEGSPNYYIDNPQPVDFDGAAELSVKTFFQVHRIPHPGYLEYNAFDYQGNPIQFPNIGLKQASAHISGPQKIEQNLLMTIRGATGLKELKYDQNGNIGIKFGSIITFIRYKEKPPSIRFHSPLVSEVEATPELFAKLNELNSGIGSMHFFHRNDLIIAISDIPAAPFSAEHIIQTLRMFNEIADGLDDLLSGEFGGKTAFGSSFPTTMKQ